DLIEIEDSDKERVTKKPKTKKDDCLSRESRLSYDESTTTDISNLISALHEYLELLTNALNSSTE
ncbi:10079_t:CDS:2, partial [Racocetra persica]